MDDYLTEDLEELVKGMSKDSAKLTIHLYNLNTRTKIRFVASPESLSDAYDANFSEVNILGRSSPVLIYSGGSSRSLSFTVIFHEDLLEQDTDIRTFTDKIKALSYPVYDSGVRVPRVYAKIGNIFSFWGILNTKIDYKPPIRNGRMIVAEVQFTFKRISAIQRGNNIIENNPLDAYDVENGKYRS